MDRRHHQLCLRTGGMRNQFSCMAGCKHQACRRARGKCESSSSDQPKSRQRKSKCVEIVCQALPIVPALARGGDAKSSGTVTAATREIEELHECRSKQKHDIVPR